MLQEQYGKLEGSCWTGREILVMYPTYGIDIQAHKPGRIPSGTDVTAECCGQGSCNTAPEKRKQNPKSCDMVIPNHFMDHVSNNLTL
jgi:hypothetical protein